MLAESGEAGKVVLQDAAIEPEQVAQALVAGMAAGRFFILPHPEVRGYYADPRGRSGPLAARDEPEAADEEVGRYGMKAWHMPELGEPRDVLTLDEVPDPEPGPGQVLVRVLGAAANFPDVLMCRGLYQVRPPLPFTPGVELCGEVVAVGADVTGFAPATGCSAPPCCRRRVRRAGADGRGQRVARAGRRSTTPRPPPSTSATRPAGSGCTAGRGWRRGRPCSCTPRPAASAARRSSSARRPAPASSAWSAARTRPRSPASWAPTWSSTGTREDFVEVVKEATGGRGADVIYDPVGGDTYPRSTKCIAFEGRILVIGFAGGDDPVGRAEPRPGQELLDRRACTGACTRFEPAAVRACHDELTKWWPTARSSRWSASGSGSTRCPPGCSGSPTAAR